MGEAVVYDLWLCIIDADSTGGITRGKSQKQRGANQGTNHLTSASGRGGDERSGLFAAELTPRNMSSETHPRPHDEAAARHRSDGHESRDEMAEDAIFWDQSVREAGVS